MERMKAVNQTLQIDKLIVYKEYQNMWGYTISKFQINCVLQKLCEDI
jgi:hypothetical protein